MGVICNICLDLHNSSDDIQPHSVIVKYLKPWTNMQIHTPHRGTKERGWMKPSPEFFDTLQYFETILTLVESL